MGNILQCQNQTPNSVMKLERLFRSASFILTKNGSCKSSRGKKGKSWGKYLKKKTANGTLKEMKNEDLYKPSGTITDIMRKRSLQIYGYLTWMNKKNFGNAVGLNSSTKWVEDVKRDVVEFGITVEMILNKGGELNREGIHESNINF